MLRPDILVWREALGIYRRRRKHRQTTANFTKYRPGSGSISRIESRGRPGHRSSSCVETHGATLAWSYGSFGCFSSREEKTPCARVSPRTRVAVCCGTDARFDLKRGVSICRGGACALAHGAREHVLSSDARLFLPPPPVVTDISVIGLKKARAHATSEKYSVRCSFHCYNEITCAPSPLPVNVSSAVFGSIAAETAVNAPRARKFNISDMPDHL